MTPQAWILLGVIVALWLVAEIMYKQLRSRRSP